MDNESDIFSGEMSREILQNIPFDANDYAIDYSLSATNNSSSDFAQVTILKSCFSR